MRQRWWLIALVIVLVVLGVSNPSSAAVGESFGQLMAAQDSQANNVLSQGLINLVIAKDTVRQDFFLFSLFHTSLGQCSPDLRCVGTSLGLLGHIFILSLPPRFSIMP